MGKTPEDGRIIEQKLVSAASADQQADVNRIHAVLDTIFSGDAWGTTPTDVKLGGKTVAIAAHIYPAMEDVDYDRAIGIVKDGKNYTIELHDSSNNNPTHEHSELKCFEIGVTDKIFTVATIPSNPKIVYHDTKELPFNLSDILTGFSQSGPAYDPFSPQMRERAHGIARKMRGNTTKHNIFKHPALQKGLDLSLGIVA